MSAKSVIAYAGALFYAKYEGCKKKGCKKIIGAVAGMWNVETCPTLEVLCRRCIAARKTPPMVQFLPTPVIVSDIQGPGLERGTHDPATKWRHRAFMGMAT